MSSNFPPNPYGDQFSPQQPPFNPYGSPQFGGQGFLPHELVRAVKGKVLPPAIILLIISCIGLALTIFNVAWAIFADPKAMIDPNAPQWLQEMQRESNSTATLVFQSLFLIVNPVIIFGAIQMMRIKMRPFAFVASIVAMLNLGTFCCIVGLPVGIWSLIILCQPDVARAFEINKQTSGM